MKRRRTILWSLALCTLPSICSAQQSLPNAPGPADPASKPASPVYVPPTQGERFKAYLKHTYGISSVIEAAARGGIEQKRGEPSEWPQGGQGYADRFGSSMGQIAIRGTTSYVIADLFKEDLRRCTSCTNSKFKAALEDTFMARKGEDGHEALSVARIVAPWSGSAVAIKTWYPSGYGGGEIARQASLSYGFQFLRNYIHELTH